jgi:hypothetical protein
MTSHNIVSTDVIETLVSVTFATAVKHELVSWPLQLCSCVVTVRFNECWVVFHMHLFQWQEMIVVQHKICAGERKISMHTLWKVV